MFIKNVKNFDNATDSNINSVGSYLVDSIN